jgi:parvulin-like peptidyl-prolyl isomerase
MVQLPTLVERYQSIDLWCENDKCRGWFHSRHFHVEKYIIVRVHWRKTARFFTPQARKTLADDKMSVSCERKFLANKSCTRLFAGLAFLLCSTGPLYAAGDTGQANKRQQVLVEVGNTTITVQDLRKTLASSPFGVQFNAMDKDAQASLRGVVLKRLVSSRLLQLEAVEQKLADSPAFKRDIDGFRKSLLYRRYMDELRNSVKMSRESLKQLMLDYKDNPDALTAARSTNITKRYRALRVLAIQHLRDSYNVRTFEDRIKPGITDDTILLQGRNIGITYGDLIGGLDLATPPDANWVKERLYQQAEVELVADATAASIDVSGQVHNYKKERLPGLLRAQLGKKWIKNDLTLRDYYKAHPEIGTVATRWHIGQIVVATKDEATRLRNAIVKGASLFKMAGQYSIDPYGKSVNGDMGWLRAGKAHPDIEKAISQLKDGDVSEIIKTPRGFHLIIVLDKREGRKMSFASITDKIRQVFMDVKMAGYLKELQNKHKVVWKLLGQKNTGPNDKI